MRFTIALSLFLAAALTQTAALSCDSECAACWKDGETGVDIKFWCNSDTSECGSECPPGYGGIHCAKTGRCQCRIGHHCDIVGPCLCGIHVNDGYELCDTPPSGGGINCSD